MKKRRFPYITTILFLIICSSVCIGVMESEKSSTQENSEQLEKRINQAIIQCYSIEGIYPPTLDYLQENYHIYIDQTLYQVNYLYEGDNIQPHLLIMQKEQ